MNRLVCKCAKLFVIANEIAGFGGVVFFLVILCNELAVKCVNRVC